MSDETQKSLPSSYQAILKKSRRKALKMSPLFGVVVAGVIVSTILVVDAVLDCSDADGKPVSAVLSGGEDRTCDFGVKLERYLD